MGILAFENELWFIALPAIVIVTLLMLRTTRRKLSHPQNDLQSYAREQIARLKDQHEMKGDMEQLLVDIQELSRKINAQLDTKFAKLEASIRAADERISALQRLNQSAGSQSSINLMIDDDVASAAVEPVPDDPAPAPPAPVNTARVFALADEGKSAVEIAQLTGEAVGEIELKLRLRR